MADACSVDGCEKNRHTLGMCQSHYQKARYYGERPPLPERDCASCGARFSARKWGSIYCSRRCNDRARHARRAAEAGRRATACEQCGASLANRRRDARFCSDRCGQDHRNAAASAAILNAKASRPPCRGCGGPVAPSKSNKAEFCSARCRIKARRHEKYNLTHEELAALLRQHHGCAICGTSDWGAKGPCVDHCHKTGAVRGILCSSCNNGLGRFRDEPERLRRAAAYLEKAGDVECRSTSPIA